MALTVACVAGLAASARGQTAEAEVVRVVERLFDGMRSADSAAVRAVFHPDARLMTVAEREGQGGLRTDSVDEFVRIVGTPRDEVWDERIWDVEVRVDGRLATAWMNYAFHVGDRFSHCGVNAFQLFRGTDGWQVFQLTDTRRREGCDVPPADRAARSGPVGAHRALAASAAAFPPAPAASTARQ